MTNKERRWLWEESLGRDIVEAHGGLEAYSDEIKYYHDDPEMHLSYHDAKTEVIRDRGREELKRLREKRDPLTTPIQDRQKQRKAAAYRSGNSAAEAEAFEDFGEAEAFENILKAKAQKTPLPRDMSKGSKMSIEKVEQNFAQSGMKLEEKIIPPETNSAIYSENIPTLRNADTIFSGEFREKYSRDNFQSAWDKRNQLANKIREFRKSHGMKSRKYKTKGLSKDDAERFKELITEKQKIDAGIKEQITARKGIFAEGRMEDLDAQIKGLNKNDPFYASKKEILESQREVARGQFSAGAKLQEARYSSEYNKNMRRLSKMNPDSPEAMALFERNRGIKENMNKITRKLNAPSGGKWSTFKKVGMGALGVLALAGIANMMFAGGERKNAELYNPNAAFQYA